MEISNWADSIAEPLTLAELSDSEICELGLEDLALAVLDHLGSTNEWNLNNFRVSSVVRRRTHEAQHCLNEAIGWLLSNGVITFGRPGQSSTEAISITRLGRRAMAEGLGRIQAGTRLSVQLHPPLVEARAQFLAGDFELAAFAAMRAVEVRVRKLAGASQSLVGVALMRESFHPAQGALRDESSDPGERQGLMDLFAGAIGTFKNPVGHRQVDYADATEASEVVLLAALLHRLLDRVEARSLPAPGSPAP